MPFQRTLLAAWPLFAGLILMMIGNGLLSTLLGVRATRQGFDGPVTGLIMSLYYAGYMGGTRAVPKLLKNVGHIRVFAALASLASATALFYGLFVTPAIWSILRILTGFAYAGLYIVVESWLNNLATKETRGKILAIYLLTIYLGIIAGQFLLNSFDPRSDSLFIVASVMVSCAVVPISLSKRPAPEFTMPQVMSPRDLWRISPLGAFVIALSGLANSMLQSIGPVYAAQRGFDTPQIAGFMAAMIAGGVMFQLPIGYMSDNMERRRVLIFVCLASCVSALLSFITAFWGGTPFYFSAFLTGGFSMTIYGLCVAYTNDHLEPHQYVSATSSMLLINGSGAIAGPLLATGAMSLMGPAAYFPLIALVYAAMALFGFYRTTVSRAPAIETQSAFQASTPDALAMAKIKESGVGSA